MRRHFIHQPDTISRAVEQVALAVHFSRLNLQYYWKSTALTNFVCGRSVGRQMHVMTLALVQSFRSD